MKNYGTCNKQLQNFSLINIKSDSSKFIWTVSYAAC